MKFKFENLGLLNEAELELSNLTIICGENNTGKTYATYAIYGFLRNWRQLLRMVMMKELFSLEHSENKYQIDLEEKFKGNINEYLNRLGVMYTSMLHEVFAAKEDSFQETKITISIDNEIDISKKTFQRRLQRGGGIVLATIIKNKDSTILEVLSSDGNDSISHLGFVDFIIDAIAEIVFAPYFPNPHISSAERTGAAIFRRELDIARTRILKAINEMDSKDIKSPWRLLQEIETDYAWPVEDNVEFVRQLEDINKQTSELFKEDTQISIEFDKIIGGSYKVVRNQDLIFQAKGSSSKYRRFTMNEASSCARALLDIGFYLRCKAKTGDMLIIDEPELNLHPKNQRAFARLIARLINFGIKIFMTTHSDYIIKEINTLIMLSQKTENTIKIQKKYKYSDCEILNVSLINLYITSKKGRKNGNVLKKAKIHPNLGIEVSTFDDTIEIMTNIQNALIYGE